MAITVDTIQLKFNVTPSYQQQQIQQLNADLKQATANYEALGKAAKDNAKEHSRLYGELSKLKSKRDELAKQKTLTEKQQQDLAAYNKKIEELTDSLVENEEQRDQLTKTESLARKEMVELQNQMNGVTQSTLRYNMTIQQLGERERELRTLLNNIDPSTDEWEKYNRELSETKKRIADLRRQAPDFHDELKLEEMTIKQLNERIGALRTALNDCKPNTPEFEEYSDALKETERQLKRVEEEISNTKDSFGKFIDGFNKISWAIQFAYQGLQKIISWADQYVQAFAKMDDAMTDVMKYTNQTKAEVEDMNESFKQMTTRTSREELNELAGAAGRLGIQGKENIIGFVDAADKINVALGDDLGEGAIDQIGKLTMVFGEDKTKGLNGAMLATGSAINELGANSSANTGFITEFTSRVAGMAVQARISQTDIMGYASALSQAGVEGEVASGVFAQFVTKMFTDPAKFAKAAGLEVKAFTDLLRTDANQAILQFLEAMQQKGGFDQLAPMLKSLKMQGTQAIPVLTAMSGKLQELKDAQKLASEAYEEGTSIIKEFDNANSSAAAKLEMAKKAMNDVTVELGKELLPIVTASLKAGTTALELIKTLVRFIKEYKTVITVLTAAITYYTVAANLAAIKTVVMTSAVTAARIATAALNAVLSANPFVLMATGLATAVAWLTSYTQKTKEARMAQEELNKTLLDENGVVKSDPTVKKRNQLDEVVVVGTKKKKETPASFDDDSGNKEQSARDRQRKELEAQAKAAWEREKIELRQQYQGKKQLQDEWHQKEFSAEQSYIARLLEIRKDYGAKESEIMEAVNMKLDADAKEATYREEQRKRKQQESLRNIDQMQAAEEVALAQQQLNGEVKTQEEFNQKKLELEIKFQEMRKNALTAGSAEYLAAQRQLLALELQQQQQKQKEQEQFTDSYQSTNNGILHQHFSQADSFDEMLRLNDEYRNKDLISEQQYQQNKTDILRVATDERQAIQQSAYDAINNLMASASQLFSAMQQRETQAVDAKYKKLIASAKKQGKDTTKLEEQQQAEKEAIQKRYAEKQFMMQVLQIVASTATGIARLFADLPFYAALPLTAVVAASGAMQLAAAQSAADQASGLYDGGYSDEYQEGYTKKGNPREQAGVIPVHKNEFVANHKAVANPQVRPVLDVIDRHQKIGDIQMLDATRMLEEAYGRGRYRGGYTQGDDRDIPEGDEAMDPQANSAEMITILRHIEANTADAMTVREVRDQIRRLERLEANARR